MNYIYIRASTWTQVLSPQTQLDLILAYCKTIGAEVPEENIFVDKATTSRIPLERRPQGQILVSKLTFGDSLFVLRLDRLFRKSSEIEHYLGKWFTNDGCVNLHFVSQGGNSINGSTALGRLMLKIMGAIAEFERDTIQDRNRETAHAQKARRERITRDPGPGFKWQHNGKKKSGAKLFLKVPDFEEMALLRKFAAWQAGGMSLKDITNHCAENNITRTFLRTKKVRDVDGRKVAKIGANGLVDHESVIVPWNKDSIHRGIKLVKGMDEQQRKSEAADDMERGS